MFESEMMNPSTMESLPDFLPVRGQEVSNEAIMDKLVQVLNVVQEQRREIQSIKQTIQRQNQARPGAVRDNDDNNLIVSPRRIVAIIEDEEDKEDEELPVVRRNWQPVNATDREREKVATLFKADEFCKALFIFDQNTILQKREEIINETLNRIGTQDDLEATIIIDSHFSIELIEENHHGAQESLQHCLGRLQNTKCTELEINQKITIDGCMYWKNYLSTYDRGCNFFCLSKPEIIGGCVALASFVESSSCLRSLSIKARLGRRDTKLLCRGLRGNDQI